MVRRSSGPDLGVNNIAKAEPTIIPPIIEAMHVDVFFIIVNIK